MARLNITLPDVLYARLEQLRDRINDVDVGVIREPRRVVRAVRRIEADQHQRTRRRFEQRDAEVAHVRRQLGLCLGITQLRQHVINVRIGLDVEVDVHPQL